MRTVKVTPHNGSKKSECLLDTCSNAVDPSPLDLFCALPVREPAVAKSSLPQRKGIKRWLYNYPRLCFFVLLLLCTAGSGIAPAYKLAITVLTAMDVVSAHDLARASYIANREALLEISSCISSTTTLQLMQAKLEVETIIKHWQKVLDANEQLLERGHQNMSMCGDNKLNQLETALGNASSDQVVCVVDGIRGRLNLTDGNSQSSTPQSAALLQRVQSILFDAVTTSQQSQKNTTMSSISQGLRRIAAKLTDRIAILKRGLHTEFHQLSTAIGEASSAATASLPHNLESGKATVKEGGEEIKQAVLEFLGSLIKRLQKDSQSFANLFDLNKTEQQIRDLAEWEARFRVELTAILNGTQAYFLEMLQELDDTDIEVSRDILDVEEKWSNSIMEHLANSIVVHLAKEGLMASRLPVRAEMRNRRRVVLSLPQQHEIAQREGSFARSTHQDIQQPTVPSVLDLQELRKAFLQFIELVLWLLVIADGWRGILYVLHIAGRLFTDSYSILPPIDIRDVAAIQSLTDLWGVFQGKYSCSSLLYTLLTEGVYVLENFVHFVFWITIEIVGTSFLVAWKKRFVGICAVGQVFDPEQVIQAPSSILIWLLFPDGVSDASVSPVAELKEHPSKMSSMIETWIRDLDSEMKSTWQNQSHVASDLLRQEQILRIVSDIQNNCFDDHSILTTECSLDGLEANLVSWKNDEITGMSKGILFGVQTLTSDPVASCIPLGKLQIVSQLEKHRACAMEQTLYLSVSSWWMVFVFSLTFRFIGRMLIRIFGLYWWRYLSGDRIHFTACCFEDGEIEAPEKLATAVRRNLRDLRWRIIARLFGISCAVASAAYIGSITFSSVLHQQP